MMTWSHPSARGRGFIKDLATLVVASHVVCQELDYPTSRALVSRKYIITLLHLFTHYDVALWPMLSDLYDSFRKGNMGFRETA